MRELHANFVWRGVLVARVWGRMWRRMRGVRGAVLWGDYLEKKGNFASSRAKQKPRSECFGDLLVAPTGVDPVTFRFSVERSTN